jgi:hypothetical protein
MEELLSEPGRGSGLGVWTARARPFACHKEVRPIWTPPGKKPFEEDGGRGEAGGAHFRWLLATFNKAAANSTGTHAIIEFFGNDDDSINQAIRWRQKTRAVLSKAIPQRIAA